MALKIRTILLVVFTAAVLSACGSIPLPNPFSIGSGASDSTISQANELIAQNLLFALVQVDGINPYETTVKVNGVAKDSFTEEVLNSVSRAGYAVRLSGGQSRDKLVSSSIRTHAPGPVGTSIYSVAIGAVEASRAFYVNKGRIQAFGSIAITGSNSQPIVTNDGALGLGDEVPVKFHLRDDLKNEPLLIASGYQVVGKGTTTLNPVVNDKGGDAISHDIGNTRNMYDSMTSNFDSVFRDYDIYEQTTIHFGNDSLRLGDRGKSQLETVARMIDPSRDIVSVIGCSLGPTGITNGNEVLAKGRAGRVKEELVFSGIDSKIIFDEGCWAPSRMDEVMPSRAVIVSIKRAVS